MELLMQDVQALSKELIERHFTPRRDFDYVESESSEPAPTASASTRSREVTKLQSISKVQAGKAPASKSSMQELDEEEIVGTASLYSRTQTPKQIPKSRSSRPSSEEVNRVMIPKLPEVIKRPSSSDAGSERSTPSARTKPNAAPPKAAKLGKTESKSKENDKQIAQGKTKEQIEDLSFVKAKPPSRFCCGLFDKKTRT